MKTDIFAISLLLGLIAFPVCAAAGAESLQVTTQATIDTILELQLSDSGSSEVRFGDIRATSDQASLVGPSRVAVRVNSNIGTTYLVTQQITGNLENAQGDRIPLENLRFTTASSQGKGVLVQSLTPVSASSQTVYTSDAQGSSDTITIEYVLTIPQGQAPGDYSALLTYTVSSV